MEEFRKTVGPSLALIVSLFCLFLIWLDSGKGSVTGVSASICIAFVLLLIVLLMSLPRLPVPDSPNVRRFLNGGSTAPT